MINSEPSMRRCRSSERFEGTIRSLSPLAMRVGWVIFDRSSGVPRPHFLIDFNCVWSAFTLILASRSTVRSSSRFTSARGGLAGGVAVEEQEFLRIRPGQGRPQNVEVGDAGDLVDVLAALRAGAGEDELADKVGVLHDECLGDEAAEGEGEDVDLAEPEGLDEGVGVVGHALVVKHPDLV